MFNITTIYTNIVGQYMSYNIHISHKCGIIGIKSIVIINRNTFLAYCLVFVYFNFPSNRKKTKIFPLRLIKVPNYLMSTKHSMLFNPWFYTHFPHFQDIFFFVLMLIFMFSVSKVWFNFQKRVQTLVINEFLSSI